MRTIRPLIVLSLILIAASTASLAEIEWIADPSEALKLAEGQGRLVLVDAWAPWCAPCFEMEETTWKDEEVHEAVEPFVRLKINHDVQKLFVERYAIEHLPILLILDPEGDEVTRVYGLQSSAQVLELTGRLLEGYEAFAADVGDRKNPEAQARAAEFLLEVGGHARALSVAKKALKRAKKAPGLARRLRLALGEAQLGEGMSRAASRTFEELVGETGPEDPLRGRALAGLVKAERERGRDREADAALQQLRASFPDLAEGF